MINTWTLLQAETCVTGRGSPPSSRWAGAPAWVTATRPRTHERRAPESDQDPLTHHGAAARPDGGRLRPSPVRSGRLRPRAEPLPTSPRPRSSPRRRASPSSTAWRTPPPTSTSGWCPRSSNTSRRRARSIPRPRGAPFAEGTPAHVLRPPEGARSTSPRCRRRARRGTGLRADWNDCLNLGGGETALLTFLHGWAIRAFLEVAEPLRPSRRRGALLGRAGADQSRSPSEQLGDGDWWIRGYTREGVKIGSNDNDEGRIFLEHLALAVIAGITSPSAARGHGLGRELSARSTACTCTGRRSRRSTTPSAS